LVRSQQYTRDLEEAINVEVSWLHLLYKRFGDEQRTYSATLRRVSYVSANTSS